MPHADVSALARSRRRRSLRSSRAAAGLSMASFMMRRQTSDRAARPTARARSRERSRQVRSDATSGVVAFPVGGLSSPALSVYVPDGSSAWAPVLRCDRSGSSDVSCSAPLTLRRRSARAFSLCGHVDVGADSSREIRTAISTADLVNDALASVVKAAKLCTQCLLHSAHPAVHFTPNPAARRESCAAPLHCAPRQPRLRRSIARQEACR